MKETYTYRTDRLLDEIGNSHGYVNQQNCPKQWVGFAIELETELQEATFEIERLRKSNLQLREGAEEQKQLIQELNQRIKKYIDEISSLSVVYTKLNGYSGTIDFLGKKNERLTDKVKQLNKCTEEQRQRIKRLEEAGDAMANAYRQICYDEYDDQQVDNWFKAKEAKP